MIGRVLGDHFVTETPDSFENQFEVLLEALFEEMIQQQNDKVLRHAKLHIPHLTFDDILNPHDYPALMADPVFNYEEGIAAGLMAAQVAVRARILRPFQMNASSQTSTRSQRSAKRTGEDDHG